MAAALIARRRRVAAEYEARTRAITSGLGVAQKSHR
jgi:hypothetical protein